MQCLFARDSWDDLALIRALHEGSLVFLAGTPMDYSARDVGAPGAQGVAALI